MIAFTTVVIAALVLPAVVSAAAACSRLAGSGPAQTFAVLAGSAVTCSGPFVADGGAVGASPGSAVSGFPTPCTSSVPMHAADTVSQRGQAALRLQYGDADSRACTAQLTGMNLGSLVAPLAGGVYCFTSSAEINGTLVLDGAGDAASQWIFKIVGGLTTAPDSAVSLINSALAANVFWNVGSSATLGSTSRFVGDLAARASITLGSTATVSGRLLALDGAVTIANGGSVTVTAGGCPAVPTVAGATTTSGVNGTKTNDVVSSSLTTLAVVAVTFLMIV